MTTVYDARDNAAEEAYFGVDGAPILVPGLGFAAQQYAYDDRGNRVETAYTDGNGTLVSRLDTDVARYTIEYDALGNAVQQVGFNPVGDVVSFSFPHLEAGVSRAAGFQDYKSAYILAQQLAERTRAAETDQLSQPGPASAEALGNLSWRALFANLPAEALVAAEAALAIAPEMLWIETNRAHALMLLGRADAAQEVYLAHRGEQIPRAKGPGRDIIANDFRLFQQAGITHPQMAEILTALE